VVGALFLCCGEPALGNWALWGTSYHFWENPTLWRKPYSWGTSLGTGWCLPHDQLIIIHLPKMGPLVSSDQISLGKLSFWKFLFFDIGVIYWWQFMSLGYELNNYEVHSRSFGNVIHIIFGTWHGVGGRAKKITQVSSIGISLGTSLGTYF
jgi:hypothetical protein